MPEISISPTALQEFVDSRGESLRVDRQIGVLRGVKLLGLESRNGRRYREAALREAIHLYEGAKVNVNHPKGNPLDPRDYRDRIGVIRNVEMRSGEGLFGALHFNPKHALAEQLAWDAEHSPENVGLSHNVLAKTTQHGNEVVVETIAKVQSVDLVADPATTKGLYEHQSNASASLKDEGVESVDWEAITIEQLELRRPDLLVQIAEQHQQQLAERQERIDELVAREAIAMRREQINDLLLEHGLPLPNDESAVAKRITSEEFLKSLLEAPDDAALTRLISDRAKAIAEASQWRNKDSQIVCREQKLSAATNEFSSGDSADFVAAITTN